MLLDVTGRNKGTFYDQYTSRVSLNHFQDNRHKEGSCCFVPIQRVIFNAVLRCIRPDSTAELAASSVAL